MYTEDIERIAKTNTYFRQVLQTGSYSQLVVMSIPVGQDIGEEVHSNTDQILYIVEGSAEAIIDGETRRVEEHGIIFVPAGARHNIRNADDEDLKLFTIYSPPEHKDGTIHRTKAEATKVEEGGERYDLSEM